MRYLRSFAATAFDAGAALSARWSGAPLRCDSGFWSRSVDQSAWLFFCWLGTGIVFCYAAMRQLVLRDIRTPGELCFDRVSVLAGILMYVHGRVFFCFASLCLLVTFLVEKPQESLPSIQWAAWIWLCSPDSSYGACFFSFAAVPLAICLALFLLINGRKRIGISLVLLAWLEPVFFSPT